MMKDLPRWLVSLPGFQRKLIALTIDSVRKQFDFAIDSELSEHFEKHDLGYLLTAASVLAQSDEGICQDAALRIAQFVLQMEGASDQRRSSAALILNALTNQPALRLAVNRNLVTESFAESLPLPAQVDVLRRKLLHQVRLSDGTEFSASRFQALFWEKSQDVDWLSISAPTSAGKSFVLGQWLKDLLLGVPFATVAYIVPTRALITQVENDLRRILPSAQINVTSMPTAKSVRQDKGNVLVFTQERLHILLNQMPNSFYLNALIVDEAHKIGDRHRGVLLQEVIENATERNRELKVLFASPLTSNPELLLRDAPPGRHAIVERSDVTVNQNLIWASQTPRRPKKWSMSLCLEGQVLPVGNFELPSSPVDEAKRLPFIALALSKGQPGNILYVNAAAYAEKAARHLFDALGVDAEPDEEVAALIDLCEKTIHKSFWLVTTLRRRVAFHYGNMPLLVKSEIERLFSANKIHYLVCTSTLVEGVNMACRTIFVRGPKKGTKTLMSAEDFWNLAGRAGRWGKEFQGNIVCVDAQNPKLWVDGAAPRARVRTRIHRATDDALADAAKLTEYIQSENPLDASSKSPHLEHVFSYLCVLRLRHGTLKAARQLRHLSNESLQQLDAAVESALNGVLIPIDLIQRNIGVSPLLMQSLFMRFKDRSQGDPARYLLSEPGSDDILISFTSAFVRIREALSQKIAWSSKHAFVRALLVVRWMEGRPLARLIAERIDYLKKQGDPINTPAVIRDVMNEVEEIARYQAPRLLACYNDVLRFYLVGEGRSDLASQIYDVGVFLELGVNAMTQLSLLELGLSRTAAIAISAEIGGDNMTTQQCLHWLSENDWRNRELPLLVVSEVERVLAQRDEAA